MLDITTTYERLEVLSARVKEVVDPLSSEELAGLLCAHDVDGAAVCRHLDESAQFGFRSATLATVTLDPARRVAGISAWGPCRRTDVRELWAR
jgi:hypothetical protein